MSQSFSLEDLVALNDEIRALARAGVPLDKGLMALANDLPGRLRRHATALGKSLEDGQTIVNALDQLGSVPSAYRAVIAAGIRSGQLATALEGIAGISRRAAEIGKSTAIAMLYPILVFGVATIVVVLAVEHTTPIIYQVYQDFGLGSPVSNSVQSALIRWMVLLLPWCWAGVTATAILAWLSSRRTGAMHGGGGRLLPGGFQLMRQSRLATFTDLLALLIEQQVPLDESIQLAADGTGDRRLKSAADEFAQRIRAGQPLTALPRGIPPLLAWLLVSGCSPTALVKSLRNASAGHRRKAAEYGKWVSIYFPILLSAGFGGIVTLLYALMVMGPFYHILRSLS